jgi:hypothetical protein
MIPKKANKLYKQVAEDLEIDERLVEDFIDYMYKNLRADMSNLKYPRINVDGLGHFVAKPHLVRRSITRANEILKDHDTSTFGAYSKKIKVEEKLTLLVDLEKKISLEEKRKEEFKKLKDESSTKDNLGE